MTELTPLANVLHSKVWPLVGQRAFEQCETIAEENAFMNRAVARYAPFLLETPDEMLGLIWGVHPDTARNRKEAIRAALVEAAKPEATLQSVHDAYKTKALD
jgi:hypothetical protein